MKVIKCQPPKSPYHNRDFIVCTEPKEFDPLFKENVNDIADTMTEIMVVCGIHRCKAKASKSVVVKAFEFNYTKRHRFESAENETSIYRDDIVGDFERKCSMTRVEALLAYCIVKRAVKAFFHGTLEHSLQNPIAEAVVLKEQEFIWLHAARRTIMLFERYEHMFFEAQRNYATQILNFYKELHARLRSRADPVIVEDYHPRGCVKKIVIGTRSPPKLESEKPKCVQRCKKTQDLREYIENLPPKGFPIKSCLTLPTPCPLLCQNRREIPESPEDCPPLKKRKEMKNKELNITRCAQCNCPKLICDCHVDRDTGVMAIDCSQGPYECQWVRMDKRDKPDPCIEKPELHQCPVDCGSSESHSESDASEYCECSAESEKDRNSDSNDDVINHSEEGMEEFEPSENEENLTQIMLKNLPKKCTSVAYQTRAISKVPPPKCTRSKPITF